MPFRSLFAPRLLAAGLALAALGPAPRAAALTRDEVIRLARDNAPAVADARARLDAARALARAAGASPESTSLELAAGPRWNDSTTLEAEAAVEIPIDAGGRRDLRTTAAEAALRAAELDLEDARRVAASQALAAWYDVLHAEAAAELARERARLASELLDVARERERAGDVARIDVNAAAIEAARAESDAAESDGAPLAARARLATLIAAPDAAPAAGPATLLQLNDREDYRRLADRASDAAEALASERADVQAARAAVAAAETETELARRLVRPPPALRLAAAREEDADILQAGVVLSFGSPARARGAAEAAAAHREAAKALAASRLRAAAADIAAGLARFLSADRAASLLADGALASADENARLAHEGYAAGKFDLPTTLLMRRDALEARREHLDRIHGALLAGAELWAALNGPSLGDSP